MWRLFASRRLGCGAIRGFALKIIPFRGVSCADACPPPTVAVGWGMDSRFRIALAAAVVGITLSGCRSDGQATSVLEQAPIDSVLLNGGYRKIASCAYERLDKAAGNGIKKVDLDGSTRLALESGGVRHWELLFRPAGNGCYDVHIVTPQGRDYAASEFADIPRSQSTQTASQKAGSAPRYPR
jgi:hypothetical protein